VAWRAAWLSLCLAGLALGGTAQAQDAAAPAPLVVHLDGELGSLGPSLVRALARRTGRPVELGPPPPGHTALALPAGHVGIVPTESHDRTRATVTLIADDGRVYETEVSVPEGAAAVRALALAVVDLTDAALEAPPLPEPTHIAVGESAPPIRGGSSYVYVEHEGGLFGRRRTIDSLARPVIYLRAIVGGAFGPTRQAFVFGPGVGVGLCVGDHCVVIEGDLPILEDQRATEERTFSYRAVNLALRLQLRPIRVDDVTIGVTFGLLSRIGGAWISDGVGALEGRNRVVSGLGTRQSLELAWMIERPFEWVFEAGIDVSIDPARFILGPGASQVLEDEITGWGVTALRVRP
jgi:hypothetical protein